MGVQGNQGNQGNQGWQGLQGDQGDTGVQGPQGWQGLQGDTGDTGAQGNQGWQGLQGVQGAQGVQGFQGWQGPFGHGTIDAGYLSAPTQQSLTSSTWVDITGASFTVDLDIETEVFLLASLVCTNDAAGAGTEAEFRIVFDSETSDPLLFEPYDDLERVVPLIYKTSSSYSPGSYTYKLQWRRVSGTDTVYAEDIHMYVQALVAGGAQGSQGPQGIVGSQGAQGWQGTGDTGAQGNQGWQGGGSAPSCTLAEATATTTTTSGSDVLVNSMTLTPAAGTYLVTFSGSVRQSASNDSIFTSIYSGGTQVAASEREFKRGSNQGNITASFCCQAKVTVNGAQAIEGRWRETGGTATMYERTLSIIAVT